MLELLSAHKKTDPITALSSLIGGLTREELDQVVPASYKSEVKRKACTSFAASMEARWTMARCMKIKMDNLLSRRQWERLRRYLSSEWSERYTHNTSGLVVNTIADLLQ